MSPPSPPGSVLLDRPAMVTLVRLARRAVEEVVHLGQLPLVAAESLAPALREERGCFVTLTRHGALRGCIGNVLARGPLFQRVRENARAAAQRDSRFDPVRADELPEIEVEVSVLTAPRPLGFTSPEDLLRRLRPGRDGVVLHVGGRTATFLPQVWEKFCRANEFLDQLSAKAGGAPDAWRQPGTFVTTYEAQVLSEAAA